MFQDLRHALRLLAKNLLFALAGILNLMKDQDRLVSPEHYVKNLGPDHDAGFDYPSVVDARKQLATIEGLGIAEELTIVVVGLVACFLPTRSATRLGPLEALRYE
jgi:hypothetical protein